MRNIIRSNQFIQMMPLIQIDLLLYKTEAGNKGVGSKQKRGRERQRGADKGSERWSILDNKKWRGLRKDHWKRTPEYFK
jgi:hypothetical protein